MPKSVEYSYSKNTQCFLPHSGKKGSEIGEEHASVMTSRGINWVSVGDYERVAGDTFGMTRLRDLNAV